MSVLDDDDPFNSRGKRLIVFEDEEPAKPYDRAEHDEQIWETFRTLEEFRSRGVMTKEEIVHSLRQVVRSR